MPTPTSLTRQQRITVAICLLFIGGVFCIIGTHEPNVPGPVYMPDASPVYVPPHTQTPYQQTPRRTSSVRDREHEEAWRFALSVVKERIRYPDDARIGNAFSGSDPFSRVDSDGLQAGEYRVRGWIDWEDETGTRLQRDFILIVKRRNGRWTVDSDVVITE